MSTLLQSEIKSFPLLFRGKVRDVYDLGDSLLMVATDRISAFDHILKPGIPEKGIILTKMSNFWMKKFSGIIGNHLLPKKISDVIQNPEELSQLQSRTEIVKKAKPLPVELIVRGYLAGTGFQEYCQTGKICGIPLPAGLKQAQQLPEPIFTPSTKAPQGTHDENISFEKMEDLVGDRKLSEQAREICLNLYTLAAEHARSRGIIIADTKIELGVMDGKLILIDEIFTPDSSRFWPLEQYRVGTSPPSYDKQFVRDYLNSTNWDKNSPPPVLPPEIVKKTAEKYREALRVLTTG